MHMLLILCINEIDTCLWFFLHWFKGVELELRKLEGAVQAIHGYLVYMKDK